MNTPYSPFNAPRKELVSRLQKNVMILLFILLLAFAGLYMLMNISLEKQNRQQERLDELLSLVHHAEERWLELLLVEDKQVYVGDDSAASLSHLHQILISEYRLIEKELASFDFSVSIDLSDALSLLDELSRRSLDSDSLSDKERESVYFSFGSLETLGDELTKIGVDLDYERQIFVERLVWAPVGVLSFIVLVIVVMSLQFYRQLNSGFSSLHYVLEHHKHGHALIVPPRNIVDEFTDLSHLIDNELSSRNFDINHQNENLTLIDKALSKVNEAFLVINHEGDIVWLSAGAEKLWYKNTAFFESMFAIDSGLDSPIGERMADSIIMSDQELTLKLSDGVYSLAVSRLATETKAEDDGSLQCIVSIQLKSEMAEIHVLHNSLKLLEQDVWGTPIRALRVESPYASFAQSLEEIRKNVETLLNAANLAYGTTNSFEKITKLQQIASLIDEKNNHNELLINDVESLPTNAVVEFDDIVSLSEQLRDSFVLGYELSLQRLALVEKDLSSDVLLLTDVDQCLNEVRAGVLSSLSATEGESQSIRHRFSVDLDHDISKVQNQIEKMKAMAASTLSLLESDRNVGMERLSRAKESVDQIIERVQELTISTPSDALNEQSSDIRIEDSSGDWDNL